MVNEPSVFEPLKFYCICFSIWQNTTRWDDCSKKNYKRGWGWGKRMKKKCYFLEKLPICLKPDFLVKKCKRGRSKIKKKWNKIQKGQKKERKEKSKYNVESEQVIWTYSFVTKRVKIDNSAISKRYLLRRKAQPFNILKFDEIYDILQSHFVCLNNKFYMPLFHCKRGEKQPQEQVPKKSPDLFFFYFHFILKNLNHFVYFMEYWIL